jgi:hypothetical protein
MDNLKRKLPNSHSLSVPHACLANVVSLAYAFIILLLPYEILSIGFSDRPNYLDNYIRVYSVIDNHYDGSPLHWVLKESSWSFIFYHLTNIVNSSNTALNLISFFSALIVTRYTLLRSNHLWLVALFFNPLMIDFFISQSRISLAFAVFLLALPSASIILKLSFTFLVSTIHFSFTLIGTFLAFKDLIHTYFFRCLNTISIALTIAMVTWVYQNLDTNFLQLIYAITSFEGGRKGDYAHMVVGSYKYLSVWILYLILVSFLGKSFWNCSSNFIAVFLILSFLVLDLADLSGIRLLPIAFPFFIISLKYFPLYKRLMFLTAFLLYVLFYWLYYMQII